MTLFGTVYAIAETDQRASPASLFHIANTKMVQSTLAPWVARGGSIDNSNGTE